MSGDLFSTTERELAIEQLHHATAIYTCEPVVDQLLDMLDWPRADRRLVDPSCGDGAFLVQALRRLLQDVQGLNVEGIVMRLQGWEIHPFAASQARARIAAVLLAHGRSTTEASAVADRVVHEGDFLLEGRGETYHAIAGNPPYLRYANVPQPLRGDYERALPDYAVADMLHSFLSVIVDRLEPDGEIACVTADRWLTNEGAGRLREKLGRQLGLAHVERLDASSAFYQPKSRRKGTPPRIHPLALVLRRPEFCKVRLGIEPHYPGAEPTAPDGGRTLGDVADVRVAPYLGTPGVFLISQDQASALPAEFLVPAVDTDDVLDGRMATPKRFAIRTRADEEPPETVLRHLDSQLPRMCERGRRATRWVPPESFERWDLSQPRLMVPRIARGLRPVYLPPGVLPVNHNLSVVAARDVSLEQLHEWLSSQQAQAWVAARAPRLENGYFSITTRFLRGLPV